MDPPPEASGKSSLFQWVRGFLVTEYQSTITDRLGGHPRRILLAGTQFDASDLTHHQILRVRNGLAATLLAEQPDIMVLDASFATPDVVEALAHARLADLPVILVAGEGDGDAAGLLLGLRIVSFLPPDASPAALAEAVTHAAGGEGLQAADAGTRFDPDSRMESLRRDAERVAAALAELAGGRAGERAMPASPQPVDAARIRAHIKARRLRERFFEAELFADPAWDMLLDLSAARLEGRQVSVSSLCIAAAVPTTTALRWIKTMIDKGLLQRASDPSDARRAFIAMAPDTATTMGTCLEACLNLQGQ